MDESITRTPDVPRGRRTENEHDVALLKDDPGALVALYQGMIKNIVMHFVTSGMFRFADVDDVMQSVSLELLSKMHVIRRQYDGSVLLKTYVSSIVRNFCLRLKQTRKSVEVTAPLEEDALAEPVSADRRVLLKEAIERLRTVLEMFDRQLPKLLLALKIYYKIPIHRDEIAVWYPGSEQLVRDELAGLIARTPADPQRTRTYEKVAPLINALEGKHNTPDSFRKWTWDNIGKVVDLLNGGFRDANFDRESLRELVEDYFSPFLLKE
jgi:RNA polymerase sigma factor (sigma-70 family)